MLLGLALALSRDRKGIRWRVVGAAFAVQFLFALVVLRTEPGARALEWFSAQVETLIGFTDDGTHFLFGSFGELTMDQGGAFALQVLPVIIFLGALTFLLLYFRVVQYATHVVGGLLGKIVGTTKVESMYASVVVFLGQAEAPLMIAPYLKRLTSSQTFMVVVGGLTAASGSTLVGYALLGAPLEYLLAATVMNAPAAIVMAKVVWPDSVTEPVSAERAAQLEADGIEAGVGDEFDVRTVRDEESTNAIDAAGRGALAGGKIAVTIGALLIAFVALIAMANAFVSGIASWFGVEDLTFQRLLGYALAPLAWLLGVPWSEAVDAGQYMGIKTIVNEFVAYAEFGPEAQAGALSAVTVVIVSFALAGFANISSIAINMGVLGSLQSDLRAFVARVGVRALAAATLANMSNAAIAGLVFAG